MAVAFVHLSDIHFGQESGSAIVIHDDVKKELIADARALVTDKASNLPCGILITGDIAYSGKREEYLTAATWLDELASAVGCKPTDVQVVPGNHDIDRSAISAGCRLMLEQIAIHGEDKLDDFLASDLDREVLYHRFSAYRPFAEGYNCPLDKGGGYASERKVVLTPGRTLRFIGLNSALVCSANDVAGQLLLGARQHVLPRTPGEEVIVLGHHPLHWLRDSDAARRYIRSRARVFVSGHEHNPAFAIDAVETGSDLLVVAAGATVPPRSEAGYGYTYNLIIFDHDAPSDGLQVTIHPRKWSADSTAFEDDSTRLSALGGTFVLSCPNFRNTPRNTSPIQLVESAPAEVTATNHESGTTDRKPMADRFPLLLLRFFRDLSPGQRLTVLADLKMLPDDWQDALTHTIERRLVDALAKADRLDELEAAIARVQAAASGEKQ